MVTDQQVRRLLMNKDKKALSRAADQAGMCENTASKYIRLEKFQVNVK